MFGSFRDDQAPKIICIKKVKKTSLHSVVQAKIDGIDVGQASFAPAAAQANDRSCLSMIGRKLRHPVEESRAVFRMVVP